MLYQKLLVGADPYFISVAGQEGFELHCHPEVELSCCLAGEYSIAIDGAKHTLQAGQMAVISPMTGHALEGGDCVRLTVEMGQSLLGQHFKQLELLCRDNLILTLNQAESLWQLLQEIAETEKLPYRNLLQKGNVYKLSGLLLQMLTQQRGPEAGEDCQSAEKIGCALDMIYNRYFDELTVEDVSAVCGYSKSSFCRVFKAVTGDTFHNTLNRHRVEIARDMLRSSSLSVEKIAEQIGFADTKSFCRVFKRLTGISAGTYRKEHP